ncbi:ribosomal prt S29 [Hepatospora eriocheir]|uniref:RS29 n=1 Tax=Hepatospora eriocheir TaxID=1081669 RepID=A0A1X0QKG8_9MICR|nr:RS29 [Hepatospora eriocheir]ORE00258.1 ribosomal prt S29 [Hepatospora eriocheir]
MKIDCKIKTDVIRHTHFSHNRIQGKGQRSCERCGNHRGFNRKYKLNLCRRCFVEKADAIGFKSLH